MDKPSILLIPGSFALPALYDGLVGTVAANGYEIKALHPPSVGLDSGCGREGPLPSLYDDAAFIASEIEKLADDGKDIVAIAHSYGGSPLSECAKGLGKEEREKRGKKGGLVRLAYVSCLVPAVGLSPISLLGGVEQRDELLLDVSCLAANLKPYSSDHCSRQVVGEWLAIPRRQTPVCVTVILGSSSRRRSWLGQEVRETFARLFHKSFNICWL